MGISTKWLRSLVGLRKVERQQRHRKEDADVGVGPGRMEAHPESNKRVLAIVDALEKLELSPKHHGSPVLEIQNFNPTSLDDVAHVHSRSYITGLEKAMGRASDEGLIFIEGTGPIYATETTFQESLLSAGAEIKLVDSVVTNLLSVDYNGPNPPLAFALVRPLGHHVVPQGPLGFRIFRNIAVVAPYAQHQHGLKRVMIIDFDVHHGNGTSDAFYDDPDIFFLSTHQLGSYPGTGKINEVRQGDGEGMTLNLPLPGGTCDYAMRCAFDEVIAPSTHRNKPSGHAKWRLHEVMMARGVYGGCHHFCVSRTW
ncbi:histone deacetylase 10, chloroplastic-like [Miscanthus floridulus]|uniref:histone deacetylase 10, chloroplastic-like n=1 Tax=Miscanthus floridulus TaxID=154761 RepID=UPI003459F147